MNGIKIGECLFCECVGECVGECVWVGEGEGARRRRVPFFWGGFVVAQ